MTKRSRIVISPPGAVEDALRRFGRNLRIARLRRRLTLEDVAGRVGVSRLTVAELEKGKPGTSAAAYFGALWALGLLHQTDGLADPHADDEGQTLELARLPRRARRRTRL